MHYACKSLKLPALLAGGRRQPDIRAEGRVDGSRTQEIGSAIQGVPRHRAFEALRRRRIPADPRRGRAQLDAAAHRLVGGGADGFGGSAETFATTSAGFAPPGPCRPAARWLDGREVVAAGDGVTGPFAGVAERHRVANRQALGFGRVSGRFTGACRLDMVAIGGTGWRRWACIDGRCVLRGIGNHHSAIGLRAGTVGLFDRRKRRIACRGTAQPPGCDNEGNDDARGSRDGAYVGTSGK